MKYLLFLVLALQLNAASYYLDYANGLDSNAGTKASPWKRHPNMKGFTGRYTAAAGDDFVLKGGVTWDQTCWPLVVSFQGSSFDQAKITTDKTWFAGSFFTQPVFDANGTEPVGGMIQAVKKSYLTFEDFVLYRYGTANKSSNNAAAVNIEDCHHLEFRVLKLQTYTQRSLYIHFNTTGTYAGYVFDQITSTNNASMLWFAGDANNVVIDGFTLTNCYLYDCASQIGNGVHGDGFVHGFQGSGGSGFAIKNINISQNKARGDFSRTFGTDGAMTALVFLEGGAYSGLIYNNDFAPSPLNKGTMFEAFITISGKGDNLGIYNNSFVNTGQDDAATAAVKFNSSNGTYVIRNNLMSRFRYALAVNTNTGNNYTFNNNLENCASGQNSTFQPPNGDSKGVYYNVWQSTYGYDKNSLLGATPIYVGAPANVALATGSPGIGAGADLSAIFKTDFSGAIRTAPWDIGAYKFGSVVIPPVEPPVEPPVVVPPVTPPYNVKIKSAVVSPDGKSFTITFE